MTAPAKNEPRCLIVASKDQEELALAMSLLHGQALAGRARLLLPTVPYGAQPPLTSPPVSFYATLDDVVAAVDDFQPDLVFLLSAYWFTLDGLASPKALGQLLRLLQDQGRGVITSDPFLGLAPRLTLAQVDRRMLGLEMEGMNRWFVRLVLALRGSRASLVTMPSLEGVTHLYAATPPDLDDGVRRTSFLNPALGRPSVGAGNDEATRTRPDTPPPQPRWVFVMSETDLRCQDKLVGLRDLTEYVLHMLRFTVQQERYPTLIAPPPLALRLASVVTDWAEVLPFSSYPEVQRRLLEAEYAFFWDAFSVSQIPRLALGLPVFAFDRGYLARALRPYYQTALQWFFGGWEPKYVDQRQLFSPYVLAHLAKAQAEALQPVRDRLRSSPAPDALVTGLRRGLGPASSD